MAQINTNFFKAYNPRVHLLILAVLLLWAVVIFAGYTVTHQGNVELGSHKVSSDDISKSNSNEIDEKYEPEILPDQTCLIQPYEVGAIPKFNVAKRIAYVSRHVGTTADFKYMAENLQLENVDYINPKDWYGFQDSKENYKKLIKNGHRDRICSDYDAVFISDSLTDGWGFIMDEDIKCKNVVFVVTNRFDYGARADEKAMFKEDMTRAINREDEFKVKIIQNNNFEVDYMKNRGVKFPSNDVPLIRPFGYTSIPQNQDNFKQEDCLIIARVDQDKILMHDLVREKTGFDCKVLEGKYGGPRTLSKYNSIVVHLPYQVSIMKMWENLAYGTLMAIPSPKFFTQICSENSCKQTEDVFETKNVFGAEKWVDHVDWYLQDWKECFVQFDSWDQLKEIIGKRDYQKSINVCRDKLMDLREHNLREWKKFLMSQ